jgi:hypothetical protein
MRLNLAEIFDFEAYPRTFMTRDVHWGYVFRATTIICLQAAIFLWLYLAGAASAVTVVANFEAWEQLIGAWTGFAIVMATFLSIVQIFVLSFVTDGFPKD